MNKRTFLWVAAALALTVVGYGVAQSYLWTNADIKASYGANMAVENALPRVATKTGNVAVQTAFLVTGIDYGDRIWGIMTATDSSAGGGYWYTAVTLDSLRWASPSLDSLACGTALGPVTIIFYDELTD